MRGRDRAYGALLGLAVGDALGMPTQYLPRETIAARYGVLDGFRPAPDDNVISRGQPAARVTDDTDQAVILGRLLIDGRGRVDQVRFARELRDWHKRMVGAGSADLLGPSTLRALDQLDRGVPPEESGRWGDTNGAAMRIAPAGIAFSVRPLDELVSRVAQAGRVTHNTGIAIAGAAAVAAAVSAGIDGADLSGALDIAVRAAEIGGRLGHYVAGADVASRIAWARGLVAGRDPGEALDLIYRLVGAGVATQEAVPAALAICSLFPGDPFAVTRYAASLGGDCDTIAAIAGAVSGAVYGAGRFPATIVEQLTAANPDLHLSDLADRLLGLRGGTDARPDPGGTPPEPGLG
ncbi:ADP-ribosylglycohydrolase family protein [Rugosimonospora africana]|uniref:ADP-ribosylglycohydrolase n=1 Tax=Rugosimonospora africana TaxID=556532 RepID=A0A8J3VTW3_9ACTN|nr:ADP-ribosylglycohydrolase family protein [Rugosimonospora africana]GIH18837.1 ADP-ribosylglycohydrolase [Rugosimonospora africana]